MVPRIKIRLGGMFTARSFGLDHTRFLFRQHQRKFWEE